MDYTLVISKRYLQVLTRKCAAIVGSDAKIRYHVYGWLRRMCLQKICDFAFSLHAFKQLCVRFRRIPRV
jgi:hypothetical protein